MVTLKIRFAGFETYTRQQKCTAPTRDERDILKTAWRLFERGDLPDKPVRMTIDDDGNLYVVNFNSGFMQRITPDGVKLEDGWERSFDILVYATGFDAITGAYDRIDISGVGGQKLRDKRSPYREVVGFPDLQAD